MQFLTSNQTHAPPDNHWLKQRQLYNLARFNQNKDITDSWVRSHNLNLGKQAGIKPGNYILDAGCGAGIPALQIAQEFPGIRVEGITPSEIQAQDARQRVQASGLGDRIQIRVGDFHYLPFPNGVFDVAFFNESIKYSKNLPQALAEVYRVLRPGGHLYITDLVSQELPLTEQQQRELAKLNQDLICHIYSLSQLAKAGQQAGFQNIEFGDFTKHLPAGDMRKLWLLNPAANMPVYYGEIKASKGVASQITPSQKLEVPVQTRTSRLVYALGTVGYDFGSQARRDSFKQLMPGIAIDGTVIPANPYDARQVVDYLVDNPPEAKSLIWTLNLDLTPIYAIEPIEAFADDVYETLQLLLAGQIEPQDSDNYIERASIPARLTNRTVQLFSGQIVPVIEPENIRGMYGWKINSLVDAALETLATETETIEAQRARVQRTLTSFLNRIYYDLRNWGQTDRDRALNFAATNAFQAASTFKEAVAAGLELDSIEIYKSAYCRFDSNCWDVKLKFFDPESNRRARKIFRFTIDVREIMPVTLGEVRSWAAPK
uniref:MusH n=1 Tax=Desmonostoc sp. (strain PCC 7906) TaxID=1181 RepID=A0A5Q0TX50_DESSP|nr:MusH [Desmonostoc sp. PCC 7906]